MVQLSVFGGVGLRRDGEVVTGRPAQRHHVAILAFLAASPGCSASRDKLIGHLWPEYDSARARHRLSVAIHVLRRGLGEDCLTASGDAVALNREVVWTDVGAFLDAVEAGKLEEAAGLYAGPFLDGFFLPDAIEYEPWMEGERDRLSGLYRVALERLIAEAEQNGDQRAAVDWWRRLAVHDRYSSSVALGLMRALGAIGDVAGAVRYARAYATLVEGDLEVPPNPEVMKLAEELMRQESAIPDAASGEEEERPAETEVARPLPALAPLPPEPPAQYVPVVRSEPRRPPRLQRDGGGRRHIALARRLAGWFATAVLLTIVAAIFLSRGAGAPDAEVPSSPTVTILPFESDGNSPALATLAQRVAEGMATNLAFVPNLTLHVGTATSAAGSSSGGRSTEAAQSTWLIEVRLEQQGSHTIASVRLVDARSNETTWSAEYDRLTADVERDPAELALAIADDLPRIVTVGSEPGGVGSEAASAGEGTPGRNGSE